MSKHKASVLDLTKPTFDVDAYIARLLKEKSLNDLVRQEEEMVASVRRLDSDVHQIVYENYNKFLTATSTVRKIQDEFNQLDTEMEELSSSMSNISNLIGDLGGVLGERRDDVLQLGSSYKVVNSLKHIFDLPNVMQSLLDEHNYGEVIRLYKLASESLTKYGDIGGVRRVIERSSKIFAEMEDILMTQLRNPTSGTDAVSKVVDLLLLIGRDRIEVQKVLLECSQKSLTDDLCELDEKHADVLDLVDRACETFIPNLTLIATTHDALFDDKRDELHLILDKELNELHAIVSRAFLSSNDAKDCSIVVRALDRYFRKISTCQHIIPGLDFSSSTVELINQVSIHEIDLSLSRIEEEMRNVLQECRMSLVNDNRELVSLSTKIEQAFVYQVKTALANLLLFTASDVTFGSLHPSEFRVPFAHNAHERLLVQAFRRLLTISDAIGSGQGEMRFLDARLLLVFAVALQHMANKSAMYLLNLCREQFSLAASSSESLTSSTTVASDIKMRAQRLVRSYAERSALEMGESLLKGCRQTCHSSASPSAVRMAIRRVVEEALSCDQDLTQLFGGDTKQKESKPIRRPLTSGIEAARDSLWCERIDFHMQIHFNKSSIMTAIVKVVLKTWIESIRVETFGKYGVEQIQVDCYYLQRGLSPLVSDEVVINSLVDQALSSALKRCSEPVLVHPSRLAQLCETQEQNRPSSRASSGLGY